MQPTHAAGNGNAQPGTPAARSGQLAREQTAAGQPQAVSPMAGKTERQRGRRAVETRALLLAREPLCRACRAMKPPRVTAAVEVDHIVPLFKGGEDTDANKQALCHDCHAAKTREDLGQRERASIGIDGYPIPRGAVNLWRSESGNRP